MNLILANILTLFQFVLAVAGGGFGLFQWRKSNELQRSKFINEILDRLRLEQDMAEALYLIESDKIWYDDNFHTGGHTEFIVDKLLAYLAYICYLRETKNITDKEMCIVDYVLYRVCESTETQKYLKHLFEYAKEKGIECTFQYIINYGLEHNIFNGIESIEGDIGDSRNNIGRLP